MGEPVRKAPSEQEREQAAAVLQQACGEGRLTLEEFSVRVGAVWAAENSDELVQATGGLSAAPVVGSAQTVDSILTVFSETKRHGRWRMRGGRLWTRTVFGSTKLDLREVLTDRNLLEISGFCLFGELKVFVPEGVEVDLDGATVFASRQLRLAPVPRVPGTPEVRVEVSGWFSSIEVVSLPFGLPAE